MALSFVCCCKKRFLQEAGSAAALIARRLHDAPGSNSNCASVRLLSFRFRLVSVLLLLLQIAGYIRVWRRRWNFTSLRLGIGSGR